MDSSTSSSTSETAQPIDLTDPVDWKARCEAAEARAERAEQRADSYRLALRYVHNSVLSVEDVLDDRGHR